MKRTLVLLTLSAAAITPSMSLGMRSSLLSLSKKTSNIPVALQVALEISRARHDAVEALYEEALADLKAKETALIPMTLKAHPQEVFNSLIAKQTDFSQGEKLRVKLLEIECEKNTQELTELLSKSFKAERDAIPEQRIAKKSGFSSMKHQD